jgi:hypothetical protein
MGTKVTGTCEGVRVLDGSAHLKSRAVVNQSASVSCCTLCLSPRANHFTVHFSALNAAGIIVLRFIALGIGSS